MLYPILSVGDGEFIILLRHDKTFTGNEFSDFKREFNAEIGLSGDSDSEEVLDFEDSAEMSYFDAYILWLTTKKGFSTEFCVPKVIGYNP